MKWIYRILRLFFCPHKYEVLQSTEVFWEDEEVPSYVIKTSQCKYCGKMLNHRIN